MNLDEITYEKLLDRALSLVPSTVDKREGSVIYDALAPACAELYQFYLQMDYEFRQCFADTANSINLERIVSERGLKRNPATYATVIGTFDPVNVVTLGSVFSYESINYTVVGDTGTPGQMYLKCNVAGVLGNLTNGSLIPVTEITGLKTANITGLYSAGEDLELDENLRKRYFTAVTAAAFGGNVSDYKTRINQIDGVDGCKVIPIWNGGGTVKVIVLGAGGIAPSVELVADIQNKVDPSPQGTGIGIAPIGHKVTVQGVAYEPINITAKFEFKPGWTFEQAKTDIENRINRYFSELYISWEDEEYTIVRLLQVEASILDLDCIIDVTNLTLNGSTTNLKLDPYKIPQLASVVG